MGKTALSDTVSPYINGSERDSQHQASNKALSTKHDVD